MSSIKNLLIGFTLLVGLLPVNAYSETLSGWELEESVNSSAATVHGQGKYVWVTCTNYHPIDKDNCLLIKKKYGWDPCTNNLSDTVNSLRLLITYDLENTISQKKWLENLRNYGKPFKNSYKELKKLKIKIDNRKTLKYKISINAEAAEIIDESGIMDFTIHGKTSKKHGKYTDSVINTFIEDKKLEQLTKQMMNGNKMLIQIGNYPMEVSLKGSAQPIKKVLNKCGIK